jgi:hypothetical protein
MEAITENEIKYTEKKQSVQNVWKENKNERKKQSKDEKIKACYERNVKKVGKKIAERKE